MNFTEHHYVSSDGLKLYYREYGQGGNVIICLPGLSRNSKDFHDLATRLAARYRVLCLDLRGRGQSDRDPNWRHYNPGTYVQDTWKLLDELHIDRLVVIGTSLGGLMAMIMSAQQAGRIRAVILNDIGPELDPRGLARILSYVGKKISISSWQEAEQQCRKIHGPAAPEMPPEFWATFARNTFREDCNGIPVADMDPAIGKASRQGVKLSRWLAIIRKTGIIKRFAGVHIDPWDSFRTMNMPCLVLRGALSDILSAEIVEKMVAVKADLEHVLIPNRGHTPLLDEPEALAAIDAFLARLA